MTVTSPSPHSFWKSQPGCTATPKQGSYFALPNPSHSAIQPATLDVECTMCNHKENILESYPAMRSPKNDRYSTQSIFFGNQTCTPQPWPCRGRALIKLGGVRQASVRHEPCQRVSDERADSGREAKATYLRFGTALSRCVHHNCLWSDHEWTSWHTRHGHSRSRRLVYH